MESKTYQADFFVLAVNLFDQSLDILDSTSHACQMSAQSSLAEDTPLRYDVARLPAPINNSVALFAP